MLDLYSFDDLFDFPDFNFEDEAQILQSSEEDPRFLKELIAHFKAALASQCPAVIKSMWENNPKLASYYSGEAIQVTNEQGLVETVKLPLKELITHFKAALAGRTLDIIKSMWENNPQLASYYSGEAIQVTNEQGLVETHKLPLKELITHFKAALASHSILVIKSMWENENSPLQNEVKELDDTKLTELIEKVLSSSKVGKSEFITIFLNFISNKRILEACLNKIILKKQSLYVKNQVTSLKNRLTSIEALSVPLSINQHIPSHHSNNEETSFIQNHTVLPTNNFESDDEFNTILDELIAGENRITPHPYATPLLNNSVFNKNNKKRPHQASSSAQHKSQRKNPDDDGESNYWTA